MDFSFNEPSEQLKLDAAYRNLTISIFKLAQTELISFSKNFFVLSSCDVVYEHLIWNELIKFNDDQDSWKALFTEKLHLKKQGIEIEINRCFLSIIFDNTWRKDQRISIKIHRKKTWFTKKLLQNLTPLTSSWYHLNLDNDVIQGQVQCRLKKQRQCQVFWQWRIFPKQKTETVNILCFFKVNVKNS